MLEQIEVLRRRVDAAFAGVVRPVGMGWVRLYEDSPDEWYATPSPQSLAELAERMEADGRRNEWSREDLRHAVKYFRNLSPAGKVFILSKVMKFALDDLRSIVVHPHCLDGPRRKMHVLEDTLWGLQPSPWAVHWCGGDPAHEELCDLLTEEQFRCITNLLGLAQRVVLPDDLDVMWTSDAAASRALDLGWSRHHTPEADAMEAKRREQLNYVWPSAGDSDVRQLISRIHESFVHATYPGDKVLSKCRCRECSEYAYSMRGSTDWRRLGPYAAINFPTLTNEAKRWFLPAEMVRGLMSGRTGRAVKECTRNLHTEEEEWILPRMFERMGRKKFPRSEGRPTSETTRMWAEEKFAEYSRTEAECIIAFLEFALRSLLNKARRELQDQFVHEGPFNRVSEVREALESYWVPSLEWRA